MIRSPPGFLQGYIGIAASGKRNQAINSAEAAGGANEGERLPGILGNALGNMKEASAQTPEGKKLTVMMGNNYFSEENLAACRERGLEAITAGSGAAAKGCGLKPAVSHTPLKETVTNALTERG
jgi:hypothetical protein